LVPFRLVTWFFVPNLCPESLSRISVPNLCPESLTLFGLTNVDPLNVEINDQNEVITDYSVQGPASRYNYNIIPTADGKIGNYDPISSSGSLRGDAINDRGVICRNGRPGRLLSAGSEEVIRLRPCPGSIQPQ
jgi:hypothetical protein